MSYVQKFQPGDKVRRTQQGGVMNYGGQRFGNPGDTFTVSHYLRDGFFMIQGLEGDWSDNYFDLVEQKVSINRDSFIVGHWYKFFGSLSDLRKLGEKGKSEGIYLDDKDKKLVFDGLPHCVESEDPLNSMPCVKFKGQITNWTYRREDFIEVPSPVNPFSLNYNHSTKQNEATNMELKNVKKNNLKEAKKQFDAEKANEEIAFAKQELLRATNEIDRLDREIKQREESKKPYLEILEKFS